MRGWIQKILDAPDRVVGLNRRNLEMIYRLNKRKDYLLANDKVKAKQFLREIGAPVPASYRVYDSLYALEGLENDLAEHPEFVVKPALGSRGNGIKLLKQSKRGRYHSGGKELKADQLTYFMASIIFGKFSQGQQDVALVEQMLHAAPELERLSQGGLPDLRILIAEERILAGMLRLTTKASDGKANLHQGGIGVGLDLERGETTRAMLDGKPITHHLDTGVELGGNKIPHWKELMEISQRIAHKCPLKYLGIDLTLDRDHGPMVIEFNARPGLEIQNVNNLGLMGLL